MKFGNTANRGFYYGSSQDSPWNQDLCWKRVIDKETTFQNKLIIDANGKLNETEKEPAKRRQRRRAASVMSSRTGLSDANPEAMGSEMSQLSATSSNAGIILEKLGAERTRLLRSQRDLLKMLTEEKKARVSTERKLENMTGKLEELTKRLEGPEPRPWRTGTKKSVSSSVSKE